MPKVAIGTQVLNRKILQEYLFTTTDAAIEAHPYICKVENSLTVFENWLGTGLLWIIVAVRGSEGQEDDAGTTTLDDTIGAHTLSATQRCPWVPIHYSWHTDCVLKLLFTLGASPCKNKPRGQYPVVSIHTVVPNQSTYIFYFQEYAHTLGTILSKEDPGCQYPLP